MSRPRPRRGRPPLSDTEETLARRIRANVSLWAEVDRRAEERGESAAEWVRDAIQQRLERDG